MHEGSTSRDASPEIDPSPASEGMTIIIPAYNEGEIIGEVVRRVRDVLTIEEHEVLVVDDGSTDATAAEAEQAGARVIRHFHNQGYGSAIKTGVRQARFAWCALIDADGQHDPADLVRLRQKRDEGYDLVIGARDKESFQYTVRMPGKKILQWTAGFLVGERPQDVNSGLRLFRRDETRAYFPILPNSFSLTTTQTLAMIKDGYQVGYIPIQTRPRAGRRSTVSLNDGLKTLLLIIRIATLFNPLKVYLPASLFLFFLGVGYAVFDMIRKFNIPDGATLLVLAGVIVFFFGILSDQLAALRRIKP